MQFRRKHWITSIALVSGATFVTAHTLLAQTDTKKAPVPAQDTKKATPPAGAGAEAEMMMKAMKLAEPGDAHTELAKLAGKWEQKFKIRMGPDMPWDESMGTSEVKPLLGGRYVMEETSFSMMGMPIQGVNIMGFDNITKEYTSLWMDTMSTWSNTSRGKKGADGSIEYKGEMVDVMGKRPFRMVVKHNADGSIDTDMFDTIPPKGDVQVMSIHSTKKM